MFMGCLWWLMPAIPAQEAEAVRSLCPPPPKKSSEQHYHNREKTETTQISITDFKN
jgi:hypothetical protein